LTSKVAFKLLVLQDVVGRVSHGFGKPADPWYFFRVLFEGHRLFPLWLIWPACGYSLARAVKLRDRRHTLLLVWAFVPTVLMSFSATKFPWYNASSYPAFALICAAPIADLVALARSLFAERRFTAALPLAILAALACVPILFNVYKEAHVLALPRTRDPIDIAAADLLRAGRLHGGPLRVVSYSLDLPRWEIPYREMLRPNLVEVPTREAFFAELAKSPNAALFPEDLLPAVAEAVVMDSYLGIRANGGRSQDFIAVSLAGTPRPPHFQPATFAFDLTGPIIDLAHGWGVTGNTSGIAWRSMNSSRAAVLIRADPVMEALGMRAEVVLAAFRSDPLAVYVNERRIGVLEPHADSGFAQYSFVIPPHTLAAGDNLISLVDERGKDRTVRVSTLSFRVD
jgi:hypothetical protein